MNTESRNCQNCKNHFTIKPGDINLYNKFDVPMPNKCFDCKMQHLFAFRNERKLYRRNCDLCNKSTVTIYSKSKPFKVYCPQCFWGDNWGAKDYAQEFDFNKPFFEQFRELQLKVPRIALLTKNSVNSEYTNHSSDNKNCYLSFVTFSSEDVYHSTDIWNKGKDIVDCLMVSDASLCYECVESEKLYNCQFCLMVKDSTDCFYSYDLKNCSNCFFCFNLRNKSYCILNKQYSKDEYKTIIQEYKLSSRQGRQMLFEKFADILKNKSLHKSATIERSVNCSGNMIYNSKNANIVFDAHNVEDSSNSIFSLSMKDCIDVYQVGLPVTENVYNSHSIARGSNLICCQLSYDNTFISYCDSCHNSNELFGCISIKKGAYCILNKEYTKEEYLDLKVKIITHMKDTGEWGLFFPTNISHAGYNETMGQIYMPMKKQEAVEKGFNWEDDITGTYGKETITELPDLIENTSEGIETEILKCNKCEKNYNLSHGEFELYKRMNIPIPDLCPDCRYLKRVSLRLPYKLWHRSCMCSQPGHFHEDSHCVNEFETSYAPDRPEKVYCEQCYQAEVL